MRADTLNATNLSQYCHHYYDSRQYDCNPTPKDVQGIPPAYGQNTFGSLDYDQDCESYTKIKDVLQSPGRPKYFCRRTPPGQQEFAYRFLEYSPDDKQRVYPYLTSRVITASAGSCNQYNFSSVNIGSVIGSKWSNYTYTNGTYSGSILLPLQVDTFDGTVYTYRGFNIPQNATVQACGQRCMWVLSHKTAKPGEESTFYQRPVTVDPVQSYSKPLQAAHEVSDDIVRLAASSIAWQGGKADTENGFPISILPRLVSTAQVSAATCSNSDSLSYL